MPYVWEDPALVVEHEKVNIFHVYINDFVESGAREYHYGYDPTCNDSGECAFDIRDLLNYSNQKSHEEILKEAIEMGFITTEGVVDAENIVGRRVYWIVDAIDRKGTILSVADGKIGVSWDEIKGPKVHLFECPISSLGDEFKFLEEDEEVPGNFEIRGFVHMNVNGKPRKFVALKRDGRVAFYDGNQVLLTAASNCEFVIDVVRFNEVCDDFEEIPSILEEMRAAIDEVATASEQ